MWHISANKAALDHEPRGSRSCLNQYLTSIQWNSDFLAFRRSCTFCLKYWLPIMLILRVLIGNTLQFSPLYTQKVNDKRYILRHYNNNNNTVSLNNIAHVVNISAWVPKKTTQDTDYLEILFSFPQSFSKAGKMPRVSHDCFYLHLSKFILHYHPVTGRYTHSPS